MVITQNSTARYAKPAPLRELLERGQLFFEKCEFAYARQAFLQVIEQAQALLDQTTPIDPEDVNPDEALIEAIASMLRLSAEAEDEEEIQRWDRDLEARLTKASGRGLAMAWHSRGVVAAHQGRARESQTDFYRALRAFEMTHDLSRIMEAESRESLKLYAKIWSSIASAYLDRRLVKRTLALCDLLIESFQKFGLASQLAPLYIVKAAVAERLGELAEARKWSQKAQEAALADRHWYFHLYVLLTYARIERKARNFQQAYWYLDLVSRAVSGPEFRTLQRWIERERGYLENDAIDLLIDSRQCEIRTREKKPMKLGKQYVLLGILEALTEAHYKDAPDGERGLSKSDIIERVWQEKYRPEAHDNKLYYNINRLRKLIEPDMKHPKYLLNWKEGYRLAPGLKIHFIGGNANAKWGNA